MATIVIDDKQHIKFNSDVKSTTIYAQLLTAEELKFDIKILQFVNCQGLIYYLYLHKQSNDNKINLDIINVSFYKQYKFKILETNEFINVNEISFNVYKNYIYFKCNEKYYVFDIVTEIVKNSFCLGDIIKNGNNITPQQPFTQYLARTNVMFENVNIDIANCMAMYRNGTIVLQNSIRSKKIIIPLWLLGHTQVYNQWISSTIPEKNKSVITTLNTCPNFIEEFKNFNLNDLEKNNEAKFTNKRKNSNVDNVQN